MAHMQQIRTPAAGLPVTVDRAAEFESVAAAQAANLLRCAMQIGDRL